MINPNDLIHSLFSTDLYLPIGALIPAVIAGFVTIAVTRLFERGRKGKKTAGAKLKTAVIRKRGWFLTMLLRTERREELFDRSIDALSLLALATLPLIGFLKLEIPYQPVSSILGSLIVFLNFGYGVRSQKDSWIGYEKGIQFEGTFYKFEEILRYSFSLSTIAIETKRRVFQLPWSDAQKLQSLIKDPAFKIRKEIHQRNFGGPVP